MFDGDSAVDAVPRQGARTGIDKSRSHRYINLVYSWNGTLINNGTFTNNVGMHSFGTITNNGTFDNYGTVDTSNKLQNNATFNNFNTINNHCDATVTGTITGNPVTYVC